MGFNCSGLGPADQQILINLQPTIIGTLRGAAMKINKAVDALKAGNGSGMTAQWMSELGPKLSMLASMINVKPIDVHFSKLRKALWWRICGGKNAVGWLAGFHRWAETDEPGRRSEFPHHSQFELEFIATLSAIQTPGRQ